MSRIQYCYRQTESYWETKFAAHLFYFIHLHCISDGISDPGKYYLILRFLFCLLVCKPTILLETTSRKLQKFCLEIMFNETIMKRLYEKIATNYYSAFRLAGLEIKSIKNSDYRHYWKHA